MQTHHVHCNVTVSDNMKHFECPVFAQKLKDCEWSTDNITHDEQCLCNFPTVHHFATNCLFPELVNLTEDLTRHKLAGEDVKNSPKCNVVLFHQADLSLIPKAFNALSNLCFFLWPHLDQQSTLMAADLEIGGSVARHQWTSLGPTHHNQPKCPHQCIGGCPVIPIPHESPSANHILITQVRETIAPKVEILNAPKATHQHTLQCPLTAVNDGNSTQCLDDTHLTRRLKTAAPTSPHNNPQPHILSPKKNKTGNEGLTWNIALSN